MKFLRILSWVFLCSFLLSGCFKENRLSCSSAKFYYFAEKMFQEKITRRPEQLTSLGLDPSKDKWNDFSQEFLKEEHQVNKKYLEKLLKFDEKSLSKKTQVYWRILKRILEDDISAFSYRFYPYRENQFFGRHSGINAFLINKHSIGSFKEAKGYIERVKGVKKDLSDLAVHLLLAKEKGIVPPRAVFSKVKSNIKSLLKGRPLSEGEDHVLVQDFKKKIKALNIKPQRKKQLIKELQEALLEYYQPAYEKHLKLWDEDLRKASRAFDGVWQHPGGADYYAFVLKQHTTTRLTPEQVYQMGLREVKRIHAEMTKIKNQLKFKGSLEDFFNDFRNNEKFYYSQPRRYIKHTRRAVKKAYKTLPLYFGLLPAHPLEIKRVESFREKSSGSAFYDRPSMDGSRPGIYSINLYNLKEHPKYKLKALAYHEGVPGHHLQISIAMGLKNAPRLLRTSTRFTAYVEGWGLYAERLAGEMGLYSSVYDEFGRLAMELTRACRLVVDTGLHYKKWSREKAIEYLIKNSDASYESSVRSVERYIVLPGQATAYMIGALKILELREKAKNELKNSFDIKEFHDQVLQNGPVPLGLLEEQIQSWIQEIKSNS